MSEIPLISIVDDDDAVRTSMQRLISSVRFREKVTAVARLGSATAKTMDGG